ERYGRVTRVFLAKDRDTGRAKGFAFVSFQDRSDAAKACEKMDGRKYSPWHCIAVERLLTFWLQTAMAILSSASSLQRDRSRFRLFELHNILGFSLHLFVCVFL